MKTTRTRLLAILALLLSPLSALAIPISESEPNDSLATAQNVEGSFSSGANGDIENSSLAGWEWTSISGTGNGTFDYYSFSALAGQTYIFDIDYGFDSVGLFDAELGLWSASGGAALSQVDDCRYNQNVFVTCVVAPFVFDPGSADRWDPMIEWTFASSGTYIIGVGEFNSFDVGGGFGGNTPDLEDTYTLQISRNMATVPEPSTLALFGLGLLGLGLARRRV